MEAITIGRVISREVTPERALWLKVLTITMNDAAGHVAGPFDASGKRAKTRQALAWIGTKDFHMVCSLAGIEGSSVIAAFNRGAFPIKIDRD